MRILAIDPGITVGYADFNTEDEEVNVGQISFKEWWTPEGWDVCEASIVEAVVTLVGMPLDGETCGADRVIMEDFTLRTPTGRSERSGLVAARVGFAVYCKLGTKFTSDKWSWSAPSAMSVMDDERLKALGLYVKGRPHGRDALRHLVIWLRKDRHGLPIQAVRV